MPKLCLWDVEPRSYHKPSASQVGALLQKNVSDAAFHVNTLFFGETTGDRQATVVCVSVGNYRSSTRKREIYCSTSISNLHLLYIRNPHMAGDLFIVLWSVIPAYLWTSLWVSLDSHYGRKLAFSMHAKAITVNLYTFHRNMSPIRRPFPGTDKTNSAHTEHLRSGQTSSPPIPIFVRHRQWFQRAAVTHFQAQLISPLIMVRCWNTNVAVTLWHPYKSY